MLLLLFSHVRLLCDTMDCSPPGAFVHEISQERILKWVAISFSRGSSWPRNQTICKQIILLVPFLFGCFLFLYLVWYLWLVLPVVSWIDMVRVVILALYQKLDERLSVLHRWLRCYLWACYKRPLLYWDFSTLAVLMFGDAWFLLWELTCALQVGEPLPWPPLTSMPVLPQGNDQKCPQTLPDVPL